MEELVAQYPVPEEKEMLLYTYVRLAHGFSDYTTRLKSVQARLQALSVLIYSNQLTDSIQVPSCFVFGSTFILVLFKN
jgi:E3 ubiquitin-protein ligase HUWE1